jgi:hypothetical protein
LRNTTAYSVSKAYPRFGSREEVFCKEETDVRILTGLFRQIEWYTNEGWKTVEEKERKGLKIR